MKTIHVFFISLFISLLVCLSGSIFGQQVGINTNTPDNSAALEIVSTDKGILIPRMTTLQRTSISNPATGLLVFDLGTSSFWHYDGSTWKELANGNQTQLEDTDGDTKIQTEESSDEDIIRFDVDGTELMNLNSDNLTLTKPFYLNIGSGNVFIGDSTGFNNTGMDNVALGAKAAVSNTTGDGITALGAAALRSNTTGSANTAVGIGALFSNSTGSNNTASGSTALFFNTTGNSNTATGKSALFHNTTGEGNTADGFESLYTNTTGFSNTAIGNTALRLNTTGAGNTAMGVGTLISNTTGSSNTAVGIGASLFNTTGWSNVAIGANALYKNTVSGNLVAVGDSTLYSNTTGTENMAIGSQAGFSNTTGHKNTFMGITSGNSNTTGFQNSFSGFESGLNNFDGNNNTFIGAYAGRGNSSGNSNVAIGTSCSFGNTTGSFNVSIGTSALFFNSGGNLNVAVGYAAMQSADDGFNNIAIGDSSLFNNDFGYNVVLGSKAGFSNQNGSGNVFIGNQSGYSETGSNKLYVENSNSSSPLIYGEFDNDLLQINGTVEAHVSDGDTTSIFLNEGAGYGFEFQYDGANDEMNLWTRKFSGNEAKRMTWKKDGKVIFENEVGVGLTPLVSVDVNGDVQANNFITVSDLRYKENIRPIENALKKVNQLNGMAYEMKENSGERTFSKDTQFGFIAQETEQVIPEIVVTHENGFKGIKYTQMVALLTEAVKEQNELIQKLEKRIEELEKE